MYDGKRVLCIAPCYNELYKIDRVVESIDRSVVDEVLVVDDGSDDGSPQTAEERGATVIKLGKTLGVGVALRHGIEYGVAHGFDILVVIAGNNKDDPQEIIRLLSPITREDYDFFRVRDLQRGDVMGK